MKHKIFVSDKCEIFLSVTGSGMNWQKTESSAELLFKDTALCKRKRGPKLKMKEAREKRFDVKKKHRLITAADESKSHTARNSYERSCSAKLGSANLT